MELLTTQEPKHILLPVKTGIKLLRLQLNNKINISIPKPCHENWEAMTLEDKGRFCSVCTKTVFDFTKASDKEIIEHLNKDATTCGRFVSSQLNRDLIVPKEKSSYWILASATLFSFLGIGSQTAYSQVRQVTIQTDKKDLNQDSIKTEKNPFTITGVVSDDLGPMYGANIVIKGSTIGISTDFDGKYQQNWCCLWFTCRTWHDAYWYGNSSFGNGSRHLGCGIYQLP